MVAFDPTPHLIANPPFLTNHFGTNTMLPYINHEYVMNASPGNNNRFHRITIVYFNEKSGHSREKQPPINQTANERRSHFVVFSVEFLPSLLAAKRLSSMSYTITVINT